MGPVPWCESRVSAMCFSHYPSPIPHLPHAALRPHTDASVSTGPHAYPGCPQGVHGLGLSHLPPGCPQSSPSVPTVSTELPSTPVVSTGILSYLYHVYRTPRQTSCVSMGPMSVPGVSVLPPHGPKVATELPSHPSARGYTHW